MRIVCLWTITVLLTACASNPGSAPAVPEGRFVEGTHYVRLDPELELHDAAGRVQVLEMFVYTCSHCFALDEKLQDWAQQAENVEFKQAPAILSPDWGELAKFYYVAEALNRLEDFHLPFYRWIHVQGRPFRGEATTREFMLSHGVDPAAFEEAYWSKNLLDGLNEARRLSVKYRLRGVPVLIVNGKYQTVPFKLSGPEETIELLDYLVAKESGK